MMLLRNLFAAICVLNLAVGAPFAHAAVSKTTDQKLKTLTLKDKLKILEQKQNGKNEHFIFDLPVTYNHKVSYWISYFQTRGKNFFRNWLEKSSKYMPYIQAELKKAGLPGDLGYMVMIESGFSATATSSASAVGPWQFIPSTGKAYGLNQNYWIDERRDLQKSTKAAIRYMKALHEEFGSWYLVAASYNMGEGGLRSKIRKFGTKDYWELVRLGALPQETQDYVPKILAALMIAKAPNLYGFRNLDHEFPLSYEFVKAPAGTDIELLADYLSVTRKSLKDLNAELVLGYIPKTSKQHWIRVPVGSLGVAQQFFRDQNKKFALD
ncbi:lytic transglycosylase domain-containing protein [Pseudobdellovibrio sp. HCB154]|uniref:lytic transglycosylase domain-containing protein n=1 Tax=Pseudobdellovibrio sp. HCB154 TaxID=3386277 RepID=UPI003916DB2F